MDYRAFSMTGKGVFRLIYTLTEGDQVPYYAERKGMFRKFHELYDSDGNLLYTIKKPTTLGKIHFELIKEGVVVANVNKPLLSNDLTITGKLGTYVLQGSLFKKQFTISNSHGIEVGKVSRKMSRLRWIYGIGVENDDKLEFYLCIVIMIDIILRMQQGS